MDNSLNERLRLEVMRLYSSEVIDLTGKSIDELRRLRDNAQRQLLCSTLPTPPPFETHSAPLVVGFAPNSSARDYPRGWGERVLDRVVSGKLWGKTEGQTKRSAGSGASGASQFR